MARIAADHVDEEWKRIEQNYAEMEEVTHRKTKRDEHEEFEENLLREEEREMERDKERPPRPPPEEQDRNKDDTRPP